MIVVLTFIGLGYGVDDDDIVIIVLLEYIRNDGDEIKFPAVYAGQGFF
jgi:hypothetical protein